MSIDYTDEMATLVLFTVNTALAMAVLCDYVSDGEEP